MKPNIFEIATSELSQDALITWLLKWADNRYSSIDNNIHLCAIKFVQALIGETDNYCITEVEAGRQWNNIDVWARINNEYFIVIEDKKGTREHSNQLKRYAEIAKRHYENTKIILVYFKMEEQGEYSEIENAGFSVFTRKNMLSVIDDYYHQTIDNKGNEILLDYYYYLKELDKKIDSFKSLPLDKWHWYSWTGFFSTIQKEIGGDWGYVHNASGGFLGFWWRWHHGKLDDDKRLEFYLQLEQHKLVFKLSANKPEYRDEIRAYYRSKLYSLAQKENINIRQYGRLGESMGVAILNEDYRITNKDGLINILATIENLRKIENLIDLLSKEINK
jgi:hypothetical protein